MPLYKQYEDGSWMKAMKYIDTPDGEITRDNLRDGREYYKSDPVGYTERLKNQQPPQPPKNDNIYIQE